LSELTIEALRARLTAGGVTTNHDVIMGKKSMGLFLENEGFAALPGPTIPTPSMYGSISQKQISSFNCHT